MGLLSQTETQGPAGEETLTVGAGRSIPDADPSGPAVQKERTVDETIAKFTTPESCEQYALNVQDRSPERAMEARRRAVELRALAHGATTDAERESLEAVYAYARVLFQTRGKNVRANYR